MLRSALAFIAWLILLGPALQAGKVLQSHIYPGPVVKVRFEDGAAIEGRMRYRIDGSEWVVDATGIEHKIDPAEMAVIESIPRPGAHAEQFEIAMIWPGVMPLIFLTLGLWASVISRNKPANSSGRVRDARNSD